MDFLFLGTGAADGEHIQPEDFANKSFRRCSSALIDNKILLDCGPHTLNALSCAKKELTNITDIVFTHLHSDHFDVTSIEKIAAARKEPLRLWAREDAAFTKIANTVFMPMTSYSEYDVCGYKITGVLANHEAFPQHLSVEKDGVGIFYGIDGAWLLGDTVRFIQNKRYDAVFIDCTVGDYSGDFRMGEHNSLPMVRLMKDSMKTLNIISEKTLFFITHLAMCLHKGYDETVTIAEKDGIIVPYDGLFVEINGK